MRELQQSYQQARTKIELWGLSHEARALIDSVRGANNRVKEDLEKGENEGEEGKADTNGLFRIAEVSREISVLSTRPSS